MQYHQISSQYVEVPRRITNISSHVCYFHNKYDDMVCSHTMISGEKHFLEDRSCLMPQHTENITRIIEHIKHILCTTINPQNTRAGYAFARRAIITPLTDTFSFGGVPFCLEYNISNSIYYDMMTPAGRSPSHTMYPIWPHPHLPPYMLMQVSVLE